jgi:tetratricopeptide (TPR) repeat protein
LMKILSSILLVIALWLAVLVGPQLSPWAWGGALLALGLAVVAALPGLWRQGVRSPGWWVCGLGVLVVGWFAGRAWWSPVADYGTMDLLLLATAAGGFVVMRGLQDSVAAERVLLWGLGLLLLASVVVTARQVVEPAFTPGFVARSASPSGFFGHYNYGANFLIGASCLIGGAALFGSCYHRLERVLWGLIAVAGIVVIYFTGSRGGQVGAAVAVSIFVVMALIGGKRRGAAWFAPGIIALPFLGILVVAFLLKGWSRSQEMRETDTGVEVLMDNTIRLHLIGIAVSCAAEHPWAGGGSRSFSWECNRFWETATHGVGGNRPEQVHNETLQAVTDYGIIGAGLLLLWVGSVVVAGIVRAMFGERGKELSDEDSWRVGGLAGLVGLLTQSNFCFVFHVVPGVLLLGLCLGRAAHPGGPAKAPVSKAVAASALVTLVGLAAAALLVPFGWLGARVTAVRLTDGFGRLRDVPYDVRLDALTEAIKLWPLAGLFLERAEWVQGAGLQGPPGAFDRRQVARVMDDYHQAAKRHPFDPTPAVNVANLLSAIGDEPAAEREFARAIQLQGGMESAYRGNFYLAAHYQRKAARQFLAQDYPQALATYQLAAAAIEKAAKTTPPWVLGVELRMAIHEGRGMVCEVLGDWQRALEAYDLAASLKNGASAHYRAAVLLGKRAKDVWFERKPEEALAGFLAAKKRFSMASEFPEEVSQAQRQAVWDYLNARITDLEAAKIKPLKEGGQ